jgi:rhamnose transport system permease protein
MRSEQRGREFAAVGALVLLLALLALRAPAFFAPSNLRDLLLDNATVLIAAVGMTCVILSREIDISIGSQFAIAGVATGLLFKAGLPMAAVVPLVLILGALMGALNGALVAWGLPSIVVTLATMTALRQGLRWATQGEDVLGLSSGFQWFGLGQEAGRILIIVLSLAVFCVGARALRHLAAGRAFYAVGTDAEAARLLGIPSRRVVFSAFLLLGLLTALSAILAAVRFPQVQTGTGMGLELKVIAAVVVGGASVSGGRGSLLGTLAGVALLGTIGPALTFLKVSAFWEEALQGLIILAAVGIEGVRRTPTHASARARLIKPKEPRTA